MFTFSFVFLLKLYDLCFDVFIFQCLKYVIKYVCKNGLLCTWIVYKNFVCWERRARYFYLYKGQIITFQFAKLFLCAKHGKCFCVVQGVPINMGSVSVWYRCPNKHGKCFCVVQGVPINMGIERRFQEMILDLV